MGLARRELTGIKLAQVGTDARSTISAESDRNNIYNSRAFVEPGITGVKKVPLESTYTLYSWLNGKIMRSVLIYRSLGMAILHAQNERAIQWRSFFTLVRVKSSRFVGKSCRNPRRMFAIKRFETNMNQTVVKVVLIIEILKRGF